jgi:hypothetical protein
MHREREATDIPSFSPAMQSSNHPAHVIPQERERLHDDGTVWVMMTAVVILSRDYTHETRSSKKDAKGGK